LRGGRADFLTLAEQGFVVFGIDASPTLLSMFRRRLPAAHAACETVQRSAFFGRQFDGAIAVGLIFLVSKNDQQALIDSVGRALTPGALWPGPIQPSIICN
jgi:cyclopropane fatty-acyl-phospholipid synthase-like methyltransferase